MSYIGMYKDTVVRPEGEKTFIQCPTHELPYDVAGLTTVLKTLVFLLNTFNLNDIFLLHNTPATPLLATSFGHI